MKRISCALLAWTFSSSIASAAVRTSALGPAPTRVGWHGSVQKPVRVRLLKNQGRLQLRGLNLRLSGETQESPGLFSSLSIERLTTSRGFAWRIRREQGGRVSVRWTTGPVVEVEGQDLRQGGENLPGRLLLHGKTQSFDLVGVVPLEDYLVGVLAGEMPTQWPIEALKAQAVAARSYALALMRERKALHFDVESSVLDQVFQSVTRGAESDRRLQRVRQAVQETQGVVLLDSVGRVRKAYYHADCGGKTAPAQSVWGSGEGTTAVVDSFCPAGPYAQWSLDLNESEIRDRLTKKTGSGRTHRRHFSDRRRSG